MPVNIAATDVVLDPQREDFGATGLRVASVVRLHRLVTLTTALNTGWTGDDVKGFAKIFGNQTAIFHKINEAGNTTK